jgi:hypothetical protein
MSIGLYVLHVAKYVQRTSSHLVIYIIKDWVLDLH